MARFPDTRLFTFWTGLTELRYTQGPLSYQEVEHNLAASAPDLRSNPERRAPSEKESKSLALNSSTTDSKATSNLTFAIPLDAGEEIPLPQVQSQSEEVRTAFARGDEEAAFAREAQSMTPDPRSRKVLPPTVGMLLRRKGAASIAREGEQPNSAPNIDIPDAGSISNSLSPTHSTSAQSEESNEKIETSINFTLI